MNEPKTKDQTTMSKKDFIQLAEYIRDTANYCEPFTAKQIEHLANFCHQQNPNFKKDRWLDYVNGVGLPIS